MRLWTRRMGSDSLLRLAASCLMPSHAASKPLQERAGVTRTHDRGLEYVFAAPPKQPEAASQADSSVLGLLQTHRRAALARRRKVPCSLNGLKKVVLVPIRQQHYLDGVPTA